MNKYENLLKIWCDSLIKLQIKGYGSPHDGGFLCGACTVLHGRADNAVFPMIYMYAKTGEEKYMESARLVLSFQQRLIQSDGSVYNDGQNFWKATTVFSSIGIYKTLHRFSSCLSSDLHSRLSAVLQNSADWIFKNLKIGYPSNINYYAASAAAMAFCGSHFNREDYLSLAHTMLDYCMQHFTENGILVGEGQPHGEVTAKGCKAIDIGYNLEESIPCLVDAAYALKDKKALKALACHTEKMLIFLLPDGGLDNSFGSRNNKWSYYGSRTSDGCAAAFMILGKYNPMFFEAAKRCVYQYEKCTAGGLLAGGPDYQALGQKPCIHHTLCHAAGLADALCLGLDENIPSGILPCDKKNAGIKYFEELDTYKINIGKWLATITGYDYRTSTYTNGAAHSSGGTISMLYNKNTGPVMAGSTYIYDLTEPLNMQQPQGDIRHSSLIMRLEYEEKSTVYTTCLDPKSVIRVNNMDNAVTVFINAHFVNPQSWKTGEPELTAKLIYVFDEDSLKISVNVSKNNKNIKFILPIIENSASVITDSTYKKEKIFYLSGGFAADEYCFENIKELHLKIV